MPTIKKITQQTSEFNDHKEIANLVDGKIYEVVRIYNDHITFERKSCLSCGIKFSMPPMRLLKNETFF